MNLLIVDNNIHLRGYPQGWVVRSHLGFRHFRNAVVREPENLSARDHGVDKVILTGSTAYTRQELAWMHRERTFIEEWMKRDIPILGICFGAQLIAQHLFGKKAIAALPYPINGSIRIRYAEGSELFRGLPNPFGGITTHYDGFKVPDEFRIAETDDWTDYAFAYPGRVYGIQFHPELMGPFGRELVRIQRILFDRHVYQEFRVKTHGVHGRRILANFLSV